MTAFNRDHFPSTWPMVGSPFGLLVLCPVCFKPLIQTSPQYAACDNLEHTGLVRHHGSVNRSWERRRMYELLCALPPAEPCGRHRYRILGKLFRRVPGVPRFKGATLVPPEFASIPPNAIIAKSKLRGVLKPRFFVEVLPKSHASAKTTANDVHP